MPQAVIFIGIQATGKSTFYVERFLHSHVRICLDVLKTRHREALFLDTCIRTRVSFVIDNTNPLISDRKRYIPKARQAGYEVIGYYFDSDIEKALLRNTYRQNQSEIISDKGIRGTYKKLQLPSHAEGFAALYYVSINPGGSFEVRAWRDEDPHSINF